MQTTENLYIELQKLRQENARLRQLLQQHDISYEATEKAEEAHQLSLEDKVALFRSLFRGREDVFARRWFSAASGKSGYQPVCAREWNRDYCDKKKYKCAECPNRQFQPLGYHDIYRHLEGKDPNDRDVIGVYAILSGNTCWFLCCDFDDKSCEHGYKDDVRAYVAVCNAWGIPAYIERSRSGNGAHVWILFSEPIKAQLARQLGNAILTEAMNRDGRLSFKSYDRFFPNQDYMPDGGFGNLMALPLQGQARKNGNSIFVDDNFEIIVDQWGYLQRMRKLSLADVEILLRAHGNSEPMGELLKSTETAPWERPKPASIDRRTLPSRITIVRSLGLYIPTQALSGKVINYLKRMASFKNPEFYKNLGMRLPTYNLPRIISCVEFADDYIVLPRGCEDAVMDFFNNYGVAINVENKTNPGITVDVKFKGEPRPEQA